MQLTSIALDKLASEFMPKIIGTGKLGDIIDKAILNKQCK